MSFLQLYSSFKKISLRMLHKYAYIFLCQYEKTVSRQYHTLYYSVKMYFTKLLENACEITFNLIAF